jgi:flavin-dependent dehydrogenase
MEKDSSARRLKEYEMRWRAAIGRELEIGMRVNRMLCRMSPAELDEVVSFLASKPGLIKAIDMHGDIDRPSLLMRRMLPELSLEGLWMARMLRHVLG